MTAVQTRVSRPLNRTEIGLIRSTQMPVLRALLTTGVDDRARALKTTDRPRTLSDPEVEDHNGLIKIEIGS